MDIFFPSSFCCHFPKSPGDLCRTPTTEVQSPQQRASLRCLVVGIPATFFKGVDASEISQTSLKLVVSGFSHYLQVYKCFLCITYDTGFLFYHEYGSTLEPSRTFERWKHICWFVAVSLWKTVTKMQLDQAILFSCGKCIKLWHIKLGQILGHITTYQTNHLKVNPLPMFLTSKYLGHLSHSFRQNEATFVNNQIFHQAGGKSV